MKKQINMKAKLLLRVAAGCLLFFALGHSAGHFTRHNVTDPNALAVQKQMMENKFDMFGQLRSYDENYTGMSLNLIFTLLAFAAVLWLLSSHSDTQAGMVRNLLIPLTICISGFGVTSLLYFFPLPAISCFAATALMGVCIFKLRKQSTRS